MQNHSFIFLAGLHRSGTSLLHEILRDHPEISGFRGTGAPEDEGQHLQTVYPPGKEFGGPGKFAFAEKAYMDENHELVSAENARRLFDQWSAHWDAGCRHLIEKSPPNIIRTRFLQALFPDSRFVIIFRHPLVVAYATRKWCATSIESLIDHSLTAYEIFLEDMPHLNRAMAIRYEEFVCRPELTLKSIYEFLRLKPQAATRSVDREINKKYFEMWLGDQEIDRAALAKKFQGRICRLGYCIDDFGRLTPINWNSMSRRLAS